MKLKYALLLMAVCLLGVTAKADITLTDGNATLTLHEVAAGVVDNITDFTIEGVDQLDQQWFWYRNTISTVGSNQKLAPATVTASTSNSVTLLFQKTGTNAAGPGKFDVTITITLTGGAPLSNEAWLSQTLSAKNTAANSNLIQIFQYSDYNLDNTPASQEVTITATGALQTHITTGSKVTDSVTPNALHWQSGEAGALLTQIDTTTGGCTPAQQNLCDTAGTHTYTDAAYAFQWRSASLAPGATFAVGSNQYVATVPEPGTTGLIGAGLISLALAFRKKLRS